MFKPRNLNHYYLLNFQRIEFEQINNLLAHGTIKRTNVLVYYYCDVPIEENNATIINYQINTFKKAFINIYILEIYNLKGHVYS
jgi:hypothetical protein